MVKKTTKNDKSKNGSDTKSVPDKSDEKNNTVPQKKLKHGPNRQKFKNVLDAVLFFIIILSLTFLLIASGLTDQAEPGIKDFQKSEEYSDQILQVWLTGTIPRANYTDRDGHETVFIGSSIKQLLIEDIRIRENLGPYTDPADLGGLRDGLENEIGDVLNDLLGPSRAFNVNMSWSRPGDKNDHMYFHLIDKNVAGETTPDSLISETNWQFDVFDTGGVELSEMGFQIVLGIYEVKP